MRSVRASCVLLALIGFALGAGNLWFAAARSTIPLALKGQLFDKEQLVEHRVGIDDVFLLTLVESEVRPEPRVVRVDGAVYQAVLVGQQLEKKAWSNELRHDGKVTVLDWSLDFQRMCIVMPLVWATLALLVIIDARAERRSRAG